MIPSTFHQLISKHSTEEGSVISPILQMGETEAQRGTVTSPRSLSRPEAELRTEPRSELQATDLSTRTHYLPNLLCTHIHSNGALGQAKAEEGREKRAQIQELGGQVGKTNGSCYSGVQCWNEKRDYLTNLCSLGCFPPPALVTYSSPGSMHFIGEQCPL